MKSPTSVLQDRDDPNGDAKRMEKSWIVQEKLQVGKLNEKGKVIRCGSEELRVGDFVDVMLAPEIVQYLENKEHKDNLQVHFELRGIVRLLKGNDVRVSVQKRTSLDQLLTCTRIENEGRQEQRRSERTR